VIVSPSAAIRLLDAEPDLGINLDDAQRAEVERFAVAPTVRVGEGTWSVDRLGEVPGVRGGVRGFLVVQGLVAMRLQLKDRICSRPVFNGELVLLDGPPSESVPLRWEWSALEDSRLAVIDAGLWNLGHRCPTLGAALLERAGQQARRAQLNQAISQMPRIEERLLTFLWSVADRRGVVRSDGVWVELGLSQRAIAEIIGARRPTVSLGLKALSEAGLAHAAEGGYLLNRESLDELALLPL
jgi:hypothetical protein